MRFTEHSSLKILYKQKNLFSNTFGEPGNLGAHESSNSSEKSRAAEWITLRPPPTPACMLITKGCPEGPGKGTRGDGGLGKAAVLRGAWQW